MGLSSLVAIGIGVFALSMIMGVPMPTKHIINTATLALRAVLVRFASRLYYSHVNFPK